MNIEPIWINTIVMALGFLIMIVSRVIMRSPKESFLDHEARIRDLEGGARNGALWEERHNQHEKGLETLTVSLNALGEKIEYLSKRFDAFTARQFSD